MPIFNGAWASSEIVCVYSAYLPEGYEQGRNEKVSRGICWKRYAEIF